VSIGVDEAVELALLGDRLRGSIDRKWPARVKKSLACEVPPGSEDRDADQRPDDELDHLERVPR
jgi:hypothetical protein